MLAGPDQLRGWLIDWRASGYAGSELSEGRALWFVIDRDRDSFRRLPERFTGRAVLGNVIDRTVLEQAGIGEADAVAAVTSGDNSNIVAARVARETYEIASVVARIKDPKRAEIYQRLGIPTVATVTWTTNVAADTQLEYGTTTAYGATTPLDTALTVTHSATLTGLAPRTTYHYRVLSRDYAGRQTVSADRTFTTAKR